MGVKIANSSASIARIPPPCNDRPHKLLRLRHPAKWDPLTYFNGNGRKAQGCMFRAPTMSVR
jgi:hypothetical protein